MAYDGNITSMTDYIALGDSYTSGEGAFDYLNGTDTDSNKCHLSAHSYPMLLTRDLFSPTGGHSVACSGAVINDVGSGKGGYRGQAKQGPSFDELSRDLATMERVKADFLPGYISQQRFVGHYQPRVVTVSIGGNDIGFGDLLQRCVMPHISRHTSDSTCYNTYESRKEVVQLVDRTIPRWIALYKQLRASNPGGHIYAIGYPSIASDIGACGRNVNLGKSELAFAEELLAYLNGAIAQAAGEAGVTYVDIGRALDGHRLCEANAAAMAVNGLTAGRDSGPFGIGVLGRESYHPNALGHQLITQTILLQTANLTSRDLTTSPESSTDNLLDAPKSGRSLNRLALDNAMAPDVLHGDDQFTITADGARNGLKPNTNYTIRLNGVSGMLLANVSSNASGNITTRVSLPAGTAAGGHSLDIFGVGQDDEPVNVTQSIYVSHSAEDPDGDGLENDVDSCPYAINSGQDTDRDSLDDVCDPLIGLSGSSANQPLETPTAADTTNPQNSPILSPAISSVGLSGNGTSRNIENSQTTTVAYSLRTTPSGGSVTLPLTSSSKQAAPRSAVLSVNSARPKSISENIVQQPRHYRPTAQPAPRKDVAHRGMLVAGSLAIGGASFFALRKRQREHI